MAQIIKVIFKTVSMRKIVVLVGCLFAFACSFAQDTLSYWGLNETSGATTKEIITNTDYTIHSKWPVIERVPGVRQNALRTDGYTFWVDGNVTNTYPLDSFSVSAWIAPETYPVGLASVWSYFDTATNKGAYIAINNFGNVFIKFTANNQSVIASSAVRAEHYKWNFLVLNVDAVNGNCTVYLNGTQIINQNFNVGNLGWPTTKTFLGRSSPTAVVQTIYPVNYLNGIIDEIIVRKRRLTQLQIQQEYAALNPASAPDMTTPASRFANDFHRPKYHAIENNGWANESHGLIRYNGTYHMFYQKNGNGPFFSQQNWGHLTSNDLVTWQEKQPALYPQPGWESVGAWSGHCITDNSEVPTIFYTGVNGAFAGIGSAQSTGNLLTWNRNAGNPLLPAAPVTPANRDFRDPYLFKEGATWYMIIGSGLITPSVGTMFLYKSTDLISWQYVRPLFTDFSGTNSVGQFWEMPVFWKFGTKYMLLVNKTPQGAIPARAFYWVGNFASDTFTVTNNVIKNLDIINSLLSPTVNLDDQNRATAIGIIPDLLPPSEQYDNGWANVFSLPRVWQMQNDSLFQSPHPNLDAARGALQTFNNITIQPTGANYFNLQGFRAEITATINSGSSSRAGFILERKLDNSEYTRIYYDYVGQSFVVDRNKSSTNPNTPRDIQTEFFPLPSGQPVEWHIYIDGSVIEVFINNKWAFATRVYPVDAASKIIDLFSEGGNATASTVQIWDRGDVSSYVVTGIFGPPAPIYKTIKVFPVPATYKCYIQLPAGTTGKASISIYDVSGKKIKTMDEAVSSSTQYLIWDLTGSNRVKMPSGNYILVIGINNKNFYRAKITVTGN